MGNSSDLFFWLRVEETFFFGKEKIWNEDQELICTGSSHLFRIQ
jgi:hypothetical protein